MHMLLDHWYFNCDISFPIVKLTSFQARGHKNKTMAFEGRKIEDLRLVMASPFNRDLKISKAIKIEGWLGIVLSILFLCFAAFLTYLTVIIVISDQTIRGPDRDIYIRRVLAVLSSVLCTMYYLLGLIFFIYNIILLRKFQTGDEAAVSKMIKLRSHILSVFALPISVVVIIGVEKSKKSLVRGYIIYLLVLMTISFIFWLTYASYVSYAFFLVGVHSDTFDPVLVILYWIAHLVLILLWYRYNTNMYTLQLNIMQEKWNN